MKKAVLCIAVMLAPGLGFAQHFVAGVRVNVAPPALRFEARPPMPSPRHTWIAGYWGWNAGRHVWMAGHWALPPQPGYVWEPAEWQNEGGQWIFYAGHWRAGEAPDPGVVYQPPPPPVQEQYVTTAPPPAIEEVRPPCPFEGAAWIPGYWHWNGTRHVWVAGRWSARPAGYRWEEHRWERHDDGRWIARPGHWHHDWDHDRDEHGHRGHDRD